MDRPTECRWCGAGVRSYGQFTTFQCWTSLVLDNGWSQSPECKLKGLEDRIQRALERLETATRFELVKDEYGAYMKGRGSWGNWLDVIEVEQAIEILKGETDGQTD